VQCKGAKCFVHKNKNQWKNFTLCFFRCFFKKIQKDKKVEKCWKKLRHNTLIVLSIFMYFFFWTNSWKLLFLQKFNEKATKAKKFKSSLYIFIFAVYFYFLLLHSVKFLHDFFFRKSSSQRLKANQSASVHVWRKIVHFGPSQSSILLTCTSLNVPPYISFGCIVALPENKYFISYNFRGHDGFSFL
jgi:hypothetical protein